MFVLLWTKADTKKVSLSVCVCVLIAVGSYFYVYIYIQIAHPAYILYFGEKLHNAYKNSAFNYFNLHVF